MLFKHKIINGVWLIEPSFADNFLPYITKFLENPQPVASREPEQFLSVHAGDASDNHIRDIKDAPEGSIAVINVSGAITKHDQECGPDGLLSKSSILQAAYKSNNITAVVINLDTGGGEVNAMRLFAETISERNKPVVAFVSDSCFSAGYGIASACDYIVANSSLARVGSIGALTTIADYTERYKMQGINLIQVYATQSTDKNKEYREALEGNLEPIRKLTDTYNEYFLSLIETNRGDKLKGDRSVWGTGKTWSAEEALELGLIDEINTFNNLLNSFVC